MIDLSSIVWWDRPQNAILRSYNRHPMKRSDKLRAIEHGLQCFDLYYNHVMEDKLMAKGKKASKGFAFTTKFAAVKITAELKPEYDIWLEVNGKDADNLIAISQGDGWKMSSRWDNENDCYINSLTMIDEDDKNYDVCVVSRSDNFFEAYMLNHYKIYVLYDKKKLPTEREKENWG